MHNAAIKPVYIEFIIRCNKMIKNKNLYVGRKFL